MKRTAAAPPPFNILPHGAGWRVESASMPGMFHFVSHDGRRCTCGAFVYSRGGLPCKHMRAVKAMLQEQGGDHG
jgi:hypothetical protein